jgi:hypothetical protein
MGMQLQSKILLVAMLFAAGCAACSIDRAGLGCREGFMPDTTGRCQVFDGSFDAGPLDAGTEPDADLMVDAGPDIGPVDDAGPDAWVDPDAGPDDGGPPDGGPPDAGPPDAGPDDGGPPDGGPIDAGPPSPLLRIRYVSGSGTVGIAYRVHWIPGPAMPTMYTPWLYDCWGRTTALAVGEECLATAPELANSGAIVDMFPYDASGGTVGCTEATCPPTCNASSCPGTYTFEWAPNPPASGVYTTGLAPYAYYSYTL